MGARVPDLQGLFLRGRGQQAFSQTNGSIVGVTSTLHQSAALGQIQGDTRRKISGFLDAGPDDNVNRQFITEVVVQTGGAFSASRIQAHAAISNSVCCTNTARHLDFDSSYITPTAVENRPVNTAVRYLVRAAK